jgi:hypothetical protein
MCDPKCGKAAVGIAAAVLTYGVAISAFTSATSIFTTSTSIKLASGTILTASYTSTAAYISAGAIAGAVGGAVTGALTTGNLRGTLRGALTGAITGAAGGYANAGSVSGWGDAAKRIAVAAAGGCGAGKVSGGSCRKGATTAAMVQALTMGASELYKKVSTKTSKQTGMPYNEDGKPHFSQRGQSDVGSQLPETLYEKWKNGSLKPEDIGMNYDKSSFMQGVGKWPFMDAFAEFHDGLHDYSFIPDDQVSLILTMPPSYAVTIVAAAQPYSSYYHLTLNNQGDY